MKIIATTALAIALSAFGARAQTTTNDNPNNSATPPTSGSAATGEDKGTAGISNPQAGSTSTLPSTSTPGAPGDTSSGDVSAKTNGSGSSISGNTSSDTSDETTTTVKKHHKKHSKKQAAPQGRSDTSSMHRARPSD
ncbi:MAG: hypothetical protein ACXWLM_02885, partial [Myxococcales bacterium]